MTDDPAKKRLGRGLAALIGDMDQPVQAKANAPKAQPAADRYVPIELIGRNPANPRRVFDEAELEDLAASIRTHGVVQPVVVRAGKSGDGGYELIAGERRWRAAQRAGLTQLPVIERDVDDRTALELAIVENVQRADLNALEEAMGYQQLIDEHGYTQAELADIIGKSRSHVANTLRLLKLPEGVRTLVADGSLSAGHARTLVTAADPLALAKRIVGDGLSVRQAEQLAQQPASGGGRGGARSGAAQKDADTLALEKLLGDATGLKVTIQHGGKGGELKVKYSTLDQLDELCRRLQA
ncbi:MAG: ParB/RepB/Spo0J family partition protein [Brucellaceae bacterium]|nr:ParB/RepB/Spo0J family partition protein [Brucellaceae bacterium]